MMHSIPAIMPSGSAASSHTKPIFDLRLDPSLSLFCFLFTLFLLLTLLLLSFFPPTEVQNYPHSSPLQLPHFHQCRSLRHTLQPSPSTHQTTSTAQPTTPSHSTTTPPSLGSSPPSPNSPTHPESPPSPTHSTRKNSPSRSPPS